MNAGEGRVGDAAGTAGTAPLELALERSHDVKAKVEECAEDIAGANVLLVAARMAGGQITLAADQALATGIEVEVKVQECAEELDGVTQSLAKGIVDLRTVEKDLSEAQSALAETQAALAASREDEKEARLQALHDQTTGLPNRYLFDSRLEQAISMAKRQSWALAVMFFDLDRFKSINDNHGHAAGDAVLKELAGRLRAHARDEDTVCRNGGDEFLYLLVNPQGRDNIDRIARSVAARLAQKIRWQGLDFVVQVSIGIAIYPQDGSKGEDLVRCADAAMYLAKKHLSGVAYAEAAHPSCPTK